ncbi:MAG TPA: hypothetical protein PKW95_05380 [bacterium]|nr:hypothetical protein [bacterium]
MGYYPTVDDHLILLGLDIGKKEEFDIELNNLKKLFYCYANKIQKYHLDDVFGFEYHAYCYLFFRYADATTLVSGIWKFDPWIPTEGKIWEEIKIMPVEIG